MENLSPIHWRYGVKRYDSDRAVSKKDLNTLQDSIRLAPSSFGLQPFRVLFIEDAAIRKQLSIASYHQPQVTESSCLLVFAIETNIDEGFVNSYFENIASTRHVGIEGNLEKHRQAVLAFIRRKSSEEKLLWATHQAYLALGFLLLTAASMQIDANAMEGFQAPQYDDLLDLPAKGLHAAVLAAIGYRHKDDLYQHLVKVRRSESSLFIKL